MRTGSCHVVKEPFRTFELQEVGVVDGSFGIVAGNRAAYVRSQQFERSCWE